MDRMDKRDVSGFRKKPYTFHRLRRASSDFCQALAIIPWSCLNFNDSKSFAACLTSLTAKQGAD